MKIALFTDGIFPYVIGGMQKHSYHLAKYLANNKVYIDLYHTNQSNYDISKLEFFSEEEKKHIRSFVIDTPSLGNLPGHYIRESFEYSQRIFNLFSRNSDVDFIYAKGFSAWKLLDAKRSGYKCAPVGVNFHGYEMFQKAPNLKSKIEQLFLLRKPVLFNIKNADYLFSYGGRITELILKLGIDKRKIIESPAGIDEVWFVQQIRPTDKTRNFIFIGRYERRKGIEELTSVLKALMKKSNFRFYFVGDIPKSKRIVSENIRYLGKITDEKELKQIITASDILVCPSYSEGMPNVILEAMASGLAVVASDVGAINTLVSQQNGWLIMPGDKDGLKSALKQSLNIPVSDLDRLKKHSCINAREFMWNTIFARLMDNINRKISN